MKFKILVLVPVFMLIVLLSNQGKMKVSRLDENKGLVNEQSGPDKAKKPESKYYTVLNFNEGNIQLQKEAVRSLRMLYKELSLQGEIYGAQIVTWGDRNLKKLRPIEFKRLQRKIIEDRNDKLEAFLETIDWDMSVRKYSLLDDHEMLDHLYQIKDPVLKYSLKQAGIPSKDSALKASGRSSQSIVIFTVKNKL